MRTIPMEEWGKDQWSLLAYVETCCVDRQGEIDHRRMRCNVSRHPGLGTAQHRMEQVYRYPTRLRNGTQQPEHDDWDCFDDLEHAGLIENIGTGINPRAKLTKRGLELVAKIRRHKAAGKSFSEFVHS